MSQTQQLKIFQELTNFIDVYKHGETEKIEGLRRSPYQIIKTCEFYSNSRYLTVNAFGEYNKDQYRRDKPFYNIVNFRVNLAKTATDLDIKDIQVTSDTSQHEVESMLLNHEAYEWMKETNFARTLNKMGYTRPKYGGYLLKKTLKKGTLTIDVMDWTKTYTDLSDIMGGPIGELHHMSPVALQKKADTWSGINDVLEANYKLKKKNKDNKIDVYEITGEFSNCVLNDYLGQEDKEDDEYTFSLQKYFIADIDGKKYPLYGDTLTGELSDYFEYLSWEDDSLDLGRGVIEDSEEAQVWTNDSVINEKLAMDLAGRVGIATNSKKITGNILEHDHGKVYELEPNTTATTLNFSPAALGQYQNQIDKWKNQADTTTSSYDAATGEQPPSGTPYSQTALLNSVAMKPFDYKRQEWGIHLTTIFNKWVIPFLVNKIKKEHVLVSDYSDMELQKIDEAFAKSSANATIVDHMLSPDFLKPGLRVNPDVQTNLQTQFSNQIKSDGKRRYINVPDNFFDNIEAKVTVVTTGEQRNKAAVLQSLSTVLQTVIQSFNPNTGKFGVLEDPKLSLIFNEILEIAGSGISPISLGLPTTGTSQPQGQPIQGQPQQMQPQPQPQMANQPQ